MNNSDMPTPARICAIHQPNFFPWLGYFDKIGKVDTFIFLDCADYPKSGSSMGSWCNRVKLMVNGEPQWVSCPVVRESGPQAINTVKINDQIPWRDKLRSQLKANYQKAPNFVETFELVGRLLDYDTDKLAEFNTNAIKSIAAHIGLRTEFVSESGLQSTGKKATERLIALAKATGSDAYLCGGGSGGYQDDALFAEESISLIYQGFKPLPYGDSSRYVPGLSVIDWLMFRSGPDDLGGRTSTK